MFFQKAILIGTVLTKLDELRKHSGAVENYPFLPAPNLRKSIRKRVTLT
jgi:hypothetical protein